MKTIDISSEVVTLRMKRLDELWKLTVALRSSDLKNARPARSKRQGDDEFHVVSQDQDSSPNTSN